MESTELTPMSTGEESQLGITGERLRTLTEDVLSEIDTKWDENTMEIIRDNGERFLKDANAVEIKNKEQYEAANALFLSGAGYLKEGSGFINPFVEFTHKPWKSACDIRNAFSKPVEAGKKIIEQKLVSWRMAEKRRIEAEQRKLDAEREAKEAQERKEAQDRERDAREKAEKARRDADAKAAELKAQSEAAEAAGRKDEAAKLSVQAEKATARGEVSETRNLAKAEEHAANAKSVYTPPSILTHTVNKTETSDKGSIPAIKTWKVTIRNEMELVKAVAKGIEEGGLPITCLNLDLERVKAGIKRWAEVNQVIKYAKNGIEVEEWETLQARPSTKGNKKAKS